MNKKKAAKKIQRTFAQRVKGVGEALVKANKYINEPKTQKRLGNLAQMGSNVDEHAKKISRLLWGSE